MTTPNSAGEVLAAAQDIVDQRGRQRDQPDGERSMKRIVAAFNGLTGHAITEREGWMFMVQFKAVRALTGGGTTDDFIDGAAYFALASEAP